MAKWAAQLCLWLFHMIMTFLNIVISSLSLKYSFSHLPPFSVPVKIQTGKRVEKSTMISTRI